MDDLTVGGLRGEKEKRSTQNRLRVDSGFREFLQTPRGRGFSLLGFITSFKCFSMFGLNEVVRGRLIGSKAWNRSGKFYKPMGIVCDCPRAGWFPNWCIFVLNPVLICLRPEMAAKPGFTKWTDKLYLERNSNLGFYCS